MLYLIINQSDTLTNLKKMNTTQTTKTTEKKGVKLTPKKAFEYISEHNIRCVTIGMVTVEEARESTEWALKYYK